MSEARHTKGPWDVKRARFLSDGGYDYGIIATIDGTRRCIAETFEVIADGGRTAPAEANAHLIAAAPELYEALEKMVRAAMYGSFNTVDSHPLPLARAALSKARGEHEA